MHLLIDIFETKSDPYNRRYASFILKVEKGENVQYISSCGTKCQHLHA